MIDLGVWRQNGGFVIRLYGHERLFNADEFSELLTHLREVEFGATESISEGYKAISEEAIAQRGNTIEDLRKALGRKSPKPVEWTGDLDFI